MPIPALIPKEGLVRASSTAGCVGKEKGKVREERGLCWIDAAG